MVQYEFLLLFSNVIYDQGTFSTWILEIFLVWLSICLIWVNVLRTPGRNVFGSIWVYHCSAFLNPCRFSCYWSLQYSFVDYLTCWDAGISCICNSISWLPYNLILADFSFEQAFPSWSIFCHEFKKKSIVCFVFVKKLWAQLFLKWSFLKTCLFFLLEN